MQKSFAAFTAYLVLGLAAGLFYREFTKGRDVDGFTQLAVAHTHLLALGMLVFLIILVVDKVFGLSGRRSFTWFFWLYNVGLLMTVAMMVVHGSLTVLGHATVSPAITGIAGLGHVLITAGLACLVVTLWGAVRTAVADRDDDAQRQAVG